MRIKYTQFILYREREREKNFEFTRFTTEEQQPQRFLRVCRALLLLFRFYDNDDAGDISH